MNWQSLLQFVEDDGSGATEEDQADGEAESQNSDTVGIGKPLIYVSVADSGVEPAAGIAELASEVISTNSLTSFDFASQVIAAQEAAFDERMLLDNQYLVRFAMFERDGTHETIFQSESDGYNYALTTDVDMSDGSFLLFPETEPVVEIAAPKNGYLPAGSVSLSDVTSLYPATRWTVASYESADYSWTVGGSPRSANADGSITISSEDIGQAVVLTNDSLSSGTTTASLTVVQ